MREMNLDDAMRLNLGPWLEREGERFAAAHDERVLQEFLFPTCEGCGVKGAEQT